jgi:hypothetical protein
LFLFTLTFCHVNSILDWLLAYFGQSSSDFLFAFQNSTPFVHWVITSAGYV